MAATISPEEIAYQKANITQDKGPVVVGVSIFLTVLPAIVVVLRFGARHVQELPFKADDWLTIPAIVSIALMCACNIISVNYGLGKHLLATDPTQGYKILEVGFYLAIVVPLAHFFVKWSILLFYIRVFNLRVRWFKIAVFTTMAFVALWAVSFIVVVITQCLPPSYFWERFNISLNPPATGSCGANTTATPVATSALNTVADFAVLVIPIVMLTSLHLKTSKKIGLILIFAVGGFACAAGLVRLVISSGAYGDNQDTTYSETDTYLWALVETSVGLICACFPIVGPGVKIAHKTFSSRASQSRTSNRYLRAPSVKTSLASGRKERSQEEASEVNIGLNSLEPSVSHSSRFGHDAAKQSSI